MTQPFTYLIMCIPTKQFYYGVRYAKGCSPDDLWTTYFTSSAYVKQLIKKYGKNQFEISIRKTFTSRNKAILWEHKVLKRLHAATRIDFINKSDSIIFDFKQRTWITKAGVNKFIDIAVAEDFTCEGWSYGRFVSEITRKRISDHHLTYGSGSIKGRKISVPAWNKGKKRSSKQQHSCKLNGAKQVIIDGTVYQSKRDAMVKLNIASYHELDKLI